MLHEVVLFPSAEHRRQRNLQSPELSIYIYIYMYVYGSPEHLIKEEKNSNAIILVLLYAVSSAPHCGI